MNVSTDPELSHAREHHSGIAGAGRFAPSPTGEFHVGNMRTALLAWALARATGRAFSIRMEDLDERSREPYVKRQLEDLAALGIEWDEPVVYQHERLAYYERATRALAEAGMLYECYCTRKELAQAASAPHATPGFYPGTCRNLSDEERARRRASLHGRGPALRLKVERGCESVPVWDAGTGRHAYPTDDIVIRRGDGVFSYNFVSVLDDALMGVDQIVRGDDLLSSTGRQTYLLKALASVIPELHSWGARELTYAHVPLVLNMQGQRLAKRDGAVTLRALRECGWSVADVIELIGRSLGFSGVRSGGGFLAACQAAWAAPTTSDGTSTSANTDPRPWLVSLHERGPWHLNVTALEAGPGSEAMEILGAA